MWNGLQDPEVLFDIWMRVFEGAAQTQNYPYPPHPYKPLSLWVPTWDASSVTSHLPNRVASEGAIQPTYPHSIVDRCTKGCIHFHFLWQELHSEVLYSCRHHQQYWNVAPVKVCGLWTCDIVVKIYEFEQNVILSY